MRLDELTLTSTPKTLTLTPKTPNPTHDPNPDPDPNPNPDPDPNPDLLAAEQVRLDELVELVHVLQRAASGGELAWLGVG